MCAIINDIFKTFSGVLTGVISLTVLFIEKEKLDRYVLQGTVENDYSTSNTDPLNPPVFTL